MRHITVKLATIPCNFAKTLCPFVPKIRHKTLSLKISCCQIFHLWVSEISRIADISAICEICKGSPSFFFLLRAAGKKAVITSNSALRSSKSKLFNAGSTIKIKHFLDDIQPVETNVQIPEISGIEGKQRLPTAVLRKVAKASHRKTKTLQPTFCNHLHISHICRYIGNY